MAAILDLTAIGSILSDGRRPFLRRNSFLACDRRTLAKLQAFGAAQLGGFCLVDFINKVFGLP